MTAIRIKELDLLDVQGWKQLIDEYSVNSKQAAEELGVSVPRVFQLENSGHLHSIFKGRFLKSEVKELAKSKEIRRKKYHRSICIITTDQVLEIIQELYAEKKSAVSPKEIIAAAEFIEGTDQIVLKYRVSNAIRILMNKGKLQRIKYGHYIPTFNT